MAVPAVTILKGRGLRCSLPSAFRPLPSCAVSDSTPAGSRAVVQDVVRGRPAARRLRPGDTAGEGLWAAGRQAQKPRPCPRLLNFNPFRVAFCFLPTAYCLLPHTFSSAISKSRMMSCQSSRPREIRMPSGCMPKARFCSSGSAECVIEKGCSIRVLICPRLTARVME